MPTSLASSSVAGGGVAMLSPSTAAFEKPSRSLREAFELPSHDRRATRPCLVCCECLLMVCWDRKRVAAIRWRLKGGHGSLIDKSGDRG